MSKGLAILFYDLVHEQVTQCSVIQNTGLKLTIRSYLGEMNHNFIVVCQNESKKYIVKVGTSEKQGTLVEPKKAEYNIAILTQINQAGYRICLDQSGFHRYDSVC